MIEKIGMGGRVVEGTSLENWRRATYRGFESHPIRSFHLRFLRDKNLQPSGLVSPTFHSAGPSSGVEQVRVKGMVVM